MGSPSNLALNLVGWVQAYLAGRRTLDELDDLYKRATSDVVAASPQDSKAEGVFFQVNSCLSQHQSGHSTIDELNARLLAIVNAFYKVPE